MKPNRRNFLKLMGLASSGMLCREAWAQGGAQGGDAARDFHVCVARPVAEAHPEILEAAKDAGVTDVWQAAYFYGHWYDTPEQLRKGREQVEALGLRWHPLNVPLGHPGDSLGDSEGETPLTPPSHWRMAVRADGTRHAGTSLHPPATEENVEAVRKIAALNPDMLFLDDDFRLAVSPGVIGGCFCDWHRDRFLDATGLPKGDWETLRQEVLARKLTKLVRAWVDFTCDELTASFQAQQAAAPDVRLGNMIMYLGAEKAGIRLADYADAPFRVGELMFQDAAFNPVKGKTDELFSVLFHRRYAKPENAWSETTAFPADALSAENVAAKLVISTLTDVRHTMFMSGLTPYPIDYWPTLKPAMAKQARLHEKLAGHTPRGPFKHFWGEAQRYVGDDQPFSLWLAAGMPFEVVDTPAEDGFTFLSDFDAHALATGGEKPHWIARVNVPGARQIEESLPALFGLKQEAIGAGYAGPHVVEEKPVVCAWYPSAGGVLLWNLSQQREDLHLRVGEKTLPVSVAALDAELIEDAALRA